MQTGMQLGSSVLHIYGWKREYKIIIIIIMNEIRQSITVKDNIGKILMIPDFECKQWVDWICYCVKRLHTRKNRHLKKECHCGINPDQLN